MPGARIPEKHNSKRRNVVLICEGSTLKLMSAEKRKTYMQDLPSLTSTQEDTVMSHPIFQVWAKSRVQVHLC